MNELAKNAETILERWNRYVILLDQLSPRVRDPYLSESFKPSCGRIKMVIGDLKALTNELSTADIQGGVRPASCRSRPADQGNARHSRRPRRQAGPGEADARSRLAGGREKTLASRVAARVAAARERFCFERRHSRLTSDCRRSTHWGSTPPQNP